MLLLLQSFRIVWHRKFMKILENSQKFSSWNFSKSFRDEFSYKVFGNLTWLGTWRINRDPIAATIDTKSPSWKSFEVIIFDFWKRLISKMKYFLNENIVIMWTLNWGHRWNAVKIQIIRIEQICGRDLQILLYILTFGDLIVNVAEKSAIFSFYMQFYSLVLTYST